jgi:putative phosphoribosyl transferase
MRFRDRSEAGKQLAQKLLQYADDPQAIVLALPRGGVPVGYEVAQALRLPFDVFLVRKLGVPGHGELAMGAIASGGVRILNDDVVDYLHIAPATIERIERLEHEELQRRERLYRGTRPMPRLTGKTVILVDDGLATGATMRAAVSALRNSHPAHVIVAAPVAARTTCEAFEAMADNIICLCDRICDPFYAVGLWYDDFRQTTDAEVREMLEATTKRLTPCAHEARDYAA